MTRQTGYCAGVGGAKNSVLKPGLTLLPRAPNITNFNPDILDAADGGRGTAAWAPPSNLTARGFGSPHLTSRSTMPTLLRCGQIPRLGLCAGTDTGGNAARSCQLAVTRSGQRPLICTIIYGN